jgi:hypothetical protein
MLAPFLKKLRSGKWEFLARARTEVIGSSSTFIIHRRKHEIKRKATASPV